MALRFMDSFDHWSAATYLGKWTGIAGQGVAGGVGRFGTSGFYFDELGAPNDTIYKDLDNQATWTVGFSFYTSHMSGSISGPVNLVSFMDGTSNQCEVWITTTTGKLYVTRNGTALSAASAVTIVANTQYYIEFQATINNTGAYELRVDGVTQAVDASEDTQATANAYANRIRICGQGPNSSPFLAAYIDDVYMCDGTGGSPTDTFLGDVHVDCLFPSGNGNSSQFDGSDGNSTDNYLLVDEAVPDGDTTYVESADIGDKDTYAYDNAASATGTIYGVQVLPYAKKTDAGARSIVSVARLSATEEDSVDKPLGTTYQFHPDIREEKPGGGAWTVTDVNAAEFGIKVSA